ncbi:ionotropic receptor 93a-like isoform X2 [Daphnia pulex]|uniref:ionotropic receptor 93a-like isoform X2 n=1 Tax=Daphnia pulex TaxID=6669 RepID=UPI001EE0F7A5|nr:ionotropic receptor 93a-like isoform X2 [Daphnia pulex]
MQVAATFLTKHLISSAILATFCLIVCEFSTDADPEGRHFNYLAFHNPPYDTLIRGPNGTFTTFGASLELVKWLSAKFKFTFNVSLVNQTLIEKYGTHEASFYQLINDKNVDGVLCSFYLTMDRVERMDFTSHTWSEGFSLIVPRPAEESRLFAFIGPFQPTVWMLIFISLFVFVGMMTLFTWFYNRQRWNNLGSATAIQKSVFNYFSSHMIYVINIMTNQGCQEAFSRTSFRLLTGVWVLCAMVLVNSYTGIVTSSLTTPKMKPSIGSLEELAASRDIGVLIRHDTSIGEQILKATSGVYKVLGDQARLHPDQILGDPFTLASKLETGRYAYPFLRTFAIAFVGNQYKKDGKCRFKGSKPLPISAGYFSWLYKKNSLYTKVHSRALMDLWESGLMRFWVNTQPTIPKADQCFADSKPRISRLVPIQLSDLTSAFLILGIGIGLATLSFVSELIFFRLNRLQI